MLTDNAGKWRALSARLSNFILGEYFTDALRNTLIIVLPILLFFIYGRPEAAIGSGTGALLISLTDLPGNRTDKFKTAWISLLIFFLVALLMAASFSNTWLTAAAFLVFTFLLSMLSIFGNRLAVVGMMAIILCTFTMGLRPDQPLQYAVFILAGGSWYYAISLLQINLWPYKYLNHAIFECLDSTADFLRSKSKYYNPNVRLEECYQESIALHIRVSEKQDVVRNLLLKDKYAMNPGNVKGSRLIGISKRVIALYEQVTAIHYDYEFVRSNLRAGGTLAEVERMILKLADRLEDLGPEFLHFRKRRNNQVEKNRLNFLMDDLDENGQKILRKVLKNLEDIHRLMNEIQSMQFAESLEPDLSSDFGRYKAFLSTTVLTVTFLKQQLSFKSPAFRFSLRMSFSFLTAYALTLFFPSEKYSYWMLLTIVIVARPRFGLTWKRNGERLRGTFAGVLAGLAILYTTQNATVLLVISSVFLLGFFAFNRTHYAISVLCITPAILICLSLFHGHTTDLVSGRLYYTLAGCIIAFAGVYLFPIWEAGQLEDLVTKSIASNINYLQQVIVRRKHSNNESNVAGIARKDAHLNLAKLSEAILQVRYEPQRHKVDLVRVEAVQSLNYRVNAIVTSLFLLPVPVESQAGTIILEQQIFADLSYCVHAGHFLSGHEQGEMVSVAADDAQQLDLLAGLARELKSYFKK
ncbi:MAG: FUSC family membrane protein [Bacteroidota bacterium]